MKTLNTMVIYKIMFKVKTLIFYVKAYCSSSNYGSFESEESYDPRIENSASLEQSNIYASPPPVYLEPSSEFID